MSLMCTKQLLVSIWLLDLRQVFTFSAFINYYIFICISYMHSLRDNYMQYEIIKNQTLVTLQD